MKHSKVIDAQQSTYVKHRKILEAQQKIIEAQLSS